MITILGYDGTTVATLSLAEIAPWLTQAGSRIWVNLQDPTAEEEKQVWDTLSLPQMNGNEGPIAAASLHLTPRFVMGRFAMESEQTISFYLGRQFIITSHNRVLYPLRELWHTYQQELSRWPYGLDYLLYLLCVEVMVLPQPAAEDTHKDLSSILPDSSVPLSSHTHQLHTWHYHLHQWHKLAERLGQGKHDLLDANTQHRFQDLAYHIQAETEQVNLWQGWLTARQQKQQEQETQRTQQLLSRLVAVGVILILIVLLALALSWF